MTPKQASQLEVGDKISTDAHPVGEHHVGEVTDTGYCAFTVKWDDGQIGTLHINDTSNFNKEETA